MKIGININIRIIPIKKYRKKKLKQIAAKIQLYQFSKEKKV